MKNIFKQEPALIIGILQAGITLLVAFGLNLTVEQTGALLAFLAAVAAIFTRQNVSSPATAETLADAAISPEPTPKQAKKAAEVLGVPASLVQEAVKFAAQGLLPTTWANLIVGADYSRLLEAVNEARRRAPTQGELEDHLRKKGKA